MTTQVKIEITEANRPVDVRVVSPAQGGIAGQIYRLTEKGDGITLYLHDGVSLEVAEVQP